MAAKFESPQDGEDGFRLGLNDGSGEVVATDRSYPASAYAFAGVGSVHRAAATATIVEG